MMDAGKGNPCCLTWQELLSCVHLQSSCWYTALMSLGMTLIRANTLAFSLIGKDGPHRIIKICFGNMNLVFGSEVALLGFWEFMFQILFRVWFSAVAGSLQLLASFLLLVPYCCWTSCCCWFPAVSGVPAVFGIAAITGSLLILACSLVFLAPLLFLVPYFLWRSGCCWSLIVAGVPAVGDSLLCLENLL